MLYGSASSQNRSYVYCEYISVLNINRDSAYLSYKQIQTFATVDNEIEPLSIRMVSNRNFEIDKQF